MKLATKFHIVLTAAILFAGMAPAALKAKDHLRVVANSLVKRDSGMTLKMSVWNCGNTTVKVNYQWLPWGGDNLFLKIYSKYSSDKNKAKRIFPVIDYPEKIVPIKPQHSISGEINLNSRFTGIDKINHVKSAVLFWYYDAKQISKSDKQFAGAIFLGEKSKINRFNPNNPCN